MTKLKPFINAGISFRLVAILMLLLASCPVKSQNVRLLVDVPVPPESITRLDERCNYIVDNYWKKFNFKSSFSSLDRLDATLGQFLSVTPYATADTVYAAIDFLIKGVEKAEPKNLVTLAQLVEGWCASDTAQYPSEDLMYVFAKAVADSKKLKGPERDRFAAMSKRLANSRLGAKPADFSFTVPDGTSARFSDVTTPTVLLFFYDPDNFDSRLARTRLGSDFVIKTLIAHNLLKIIALYDGQPDEKWLKDTESFPDTWVIGAAPGISELFTMKRIPQIYYLDENRVITDKDFSTDAAIIYFGQFMKQK